MYPYTIMSTNDFNLVHQDALTFLSSVQSNSVDLILTDPPYIISRDSGMEAHYQSVSSLATSGKNAKTEDDWTEYKKTLDKPKEELKADKGKGWSKDNYIKYGSIMGKKYSVQTKFGEWDSQFTIDTLKQCIKEYYQKLKKGGTCIIWFDIWKMETLKRLMEESKFKQIRLIEWVKTNPQPINSKTNYLSNCREFAILGVKGGKPTFHSSYDKAIYQYPMAAGKYKFHPTQKNLELMCVLIKKHSNEGDVVMDTFLGGGTTAFACTRTKRTCIGCEISPDYFAKMNEVMSSHFSG